MLQKIALQCVRPFYSDPSPLVSLLVGPNQVEKIVALYILLCQSKRIAGSLNAKLLPASINAIFSYSERV